MDPAAEEFNPPKGGYQRGLLTRFNKGDKTISICTCKNLFANKVSNGKVYGCSDVFFDTCKSCRTKNNTSFVEKPYGIVVV